MAGDKAPFAYEGLDRLFHERARLGIVTSLAGHAEGLSFSDLKVLCGLTDGNLSRHLQVLEEAGLVGLDKGYAGKRPHTRCFLTEAGREGFAAYLQVLEQVLRRARETAKRGALLRKARQA
ncbi:transcriptional regulator [Sphingomonas jatrophae]|uniref:Transcriptional regulator, ArsR family n=1 Tax=Sphingomonas jatrophae TaxID=1166337 RepID=A0A1I6KEM3_9SPHN|nr:transcriptional regulator [Sphingomonas jatrophae]SFR89488.1 transcriptional regulator, ArsR family [Sphingomonas jatrophae]